MRTYLLPGILGLLIGLLLHWTGLSRREGVHQALGLHRSSALRSALYAVGAAMAMTAFLCWLAVIDVDLIAVLPLSGGVLAGGALLGIAAGLCGFTPGTAFAALGAGSFTAALEALSTLAGCFVMTLLLPQLTGLLAPLQQSAPYVNSTVFRVTLDESFLLDGGFLGQGCAGLLLAAIALCIPSPRQMIAPQESTPPPAGESSVPEPDEAPAETFVAILPGEEPLVVDTAMDEEDETAEVQQEVTAEAEPEEKPETEPDARTEDDETDENELIEDKKE